MAYGHVNVPGATAAELAQAVKSLRDEILSGKLLSIELTTSDDSVITTDTGEAVTLSRKILFE